MKDIYYCIHELVAYNAGLQIAHWRANTITNEHKVLGELYESMTDLADKFTEVYMGKYTIIPFKKGAEIPDVSSKPCKMGLLVVDDLKEYFKAGSDDDLINIIADMEATLNKAKYLLKEK